MMEDKMKEIKKLLIDNEIISKVFFDNYKNGAKRVPPLPV